MNATQQLKRLFKSKEKEEEVLETINRKLDDLVGLVEGLKSQGEAPQISLDKVKVEEFYIPDIEVDNMEVKAKAKTISKNGKNNKKVKTSVKKLKKLGGKKNGG